MLISQVYLQRYLLKHPAQLQIYLTKHPTKLQIVVSKTELQCKHLVKL
jgi:hypothetical protein